MASRRMMAAARLRRDAGAKIRFLHLTAVQDV